MIVCAHRYVKNETDQRWGHGQCFTLTQELKHSATWDPCQGREKNRSVINQSKFHNLFLRNGSNLSPKLTISGKLLLVLKIIFLFVFVFQSSRGMGLLSSRNKRSHHRRPGLIKILFIINLYQDS